MEPNQLKEHISRTYNSLRIGIAVLGIALPILLGIGGRIVAHLPLQQSMSAYYHAGGGAMRDVFVGILVAVGVFLFLYKGFTSLEDHALNLAGLFIVGVAIVPMRWESAGSGPSVSLHGTFAVLFFLSIAYVCIFRASDTLSLIDEARARSYRCTYKLIGWGMIVSPGVAVVLTWVLQPSALQRSTVFFVEAVGVVMFALYWIVKSREIARSDADRSSVEGKLRTPQHGLMELFKEMPVRVS